MTKEVNYSEVMDDYYTRADKLGKESSEAWLMVGGIWWPNPHYTGEPVCHPECTPEMQQYNPPKGPSPRERYEAMKKNG